MPRKLRVEYPGAIYHLMSRRDQREDIRLEWTEEDLAAQQKSHPIKLALAARLRRETTLTVKEIAERLHLGKPKGARRNLRKFMNQAQPGIGQSQLDMNE